MKRRLAQAFAADGPLAAGVPGFRLRAQQLEMSEAILQRSNHPVVLAFARGVLASQQSEIDLMTAMLNERR